MLLRAFIVTVCLCSFGCGRFTGFRWNKAKAPVADAGSESAESSASAGTVAVKANAAESPAVSPTAIGSPAAAPQSGAGLPAADAARVASLLSQLIESDKQNSETAVTTPVARPVPEQAGQASVPGAVIPEAAQPPIAPVQTAAAAITAAPANQPVVTVHRTSAEIAPVRQPNQFAPETAQAPPAAVTTAQPAREIPIQSAPVNSNRLQPGDVDLVKFTVKETVDTAPVQHAAHIQRETAPAESQPAERHAHFELPQQPGKPVTDQGIQLASSEQPQQPATQTALRPIPIPAAQPAAPTRQNTVASTSIAPAQSDATAQSTAVKAAIAYEKSRGWIVERVDDVERGFHLVSKKPHALDPSVAVDVRFICVKGYPGESDLIVQMHEVKLSKAYQDEFWIYTVTDCASEPQIVPVRNPAAKALRPVVKVRHYVLNPQAASGSESND